MTLSSYIESELTASAPNLRKQRRKVQLSLQSYYGDRYIEASLLDLALPERIAGYITYLTTAYTPGDRFGQTVDLTGTTSDEIAAARSKRADTHITMLRGLIGTAIQRGHFPLLDPFAAHPDYRRRQTITPRQPIADTLPKLAAASDIPAVKAYIVCLALGGITIDSLRQIIDQDTHADDPLVDTLLDQLRDIAADKPLWLQTLTEATVAANLAAHRIPCLTAGDILTDWCALASQTAILTPGQLADVIRLHLHGKEGRLPACENDQKPCESAQAVIAKMTRYITTKIATSATFQRDHWAIILTTWPETAEKLERKLLRHTTLSPSLRDNTYCACRTPQTRHPAPAPDRYRATLRTTLFVRATDATLHLLRRAYPDIWIMRRRNADTYTRIPPGQLDLMRRVLNLISSPDDISVDFAPTPEPLEPLTKDEHVLFSHPFFGDDITATVLGRVKNDELRMTNDENTTPSSALYKVQFTSMGKTITLTLPRILLTQI